MIFFSSNEVPNLHIFRYPQQGEKPAIRGIRPLRFSHLSRSFLLSVRRHADPIQSQSMTVRRILSRALSRRPEAVGNCNEFSKGTTRNNDRSGGTTQGQIKVGQECLKWQVEHFVAAQIAQGGR